MLLMTPIATGARFTRVVDDEVSPSKRGPPPATPWTRDTPYS